MEVTGNGVDFSTDGVRYEVVDMVDISTAVPSRGPSQGGTSIRLKVTGPVPRDTMECVFGIGTADEKRTFAARAGVSEIACNSAASDNAMTVGLVVVSGAAVSRGDVKFEFYTGST